MSKRARIRVENLQLSPIATKDAHPDAVLQVDFVFQGQDFDSWQLDKDGLVVKSTPFQTDIWAGVKINLSKLKIGGYAHCTLKDGTRMVLKYKITNIKTI